MALFNQYDLSNDLSNDLICQTVLASLTKVVVFERLLEKNMDLKANDED